MEDEPFLLGLDANPGDDALRLVYADWLEERGDRRGDFLRTAVAVRSAAGREADRSGLLRRLIELRAAVPSAWVVRAYRSLAEDDVREVVLRELVGEGRFVSPTFLQVEGGQDPSPYLFALLAERYVGLQPASDAAFHNGVYRDKQTGSYGYLLRIDSLEWEAEDRCSAVGGHFADGLAAQGNCYQVGVKDGWWAVLDVFNLWIS